MPAALLALVVPSASAGDISGERNPAKGADSASHYDAGRPSVWEEARALLGKRWHDKAVKRFARAHGLVHSPPPSLDSPTAWGRYRGRESDPQLSPFGLCYFKGKIAIVDVVVGRQLGYEGQIIAEDLPLQLRSEMTSEEVFRLLGPPTKDFGSGHHVHYAKHSMDLVFSRTSSGPLRLVRVQFISRDGRSQAPSSREGAGAAP